MEREFDELIYNSQGQLVKRAEATYSMAVVKAKLNQVKPSKNKKFIAIELLKDPHPFGAAELKTVEYLFYKATEG